MKKKIILTLITLLMVCMTMFSLTACDDNVEFKIKFVVDDQVYATVNTSGSEIIRMPENPTKDDYNFDGWFWDKDVWEKPFTANSLLDAPLSSDMSVYAKFTKIHIHEYISVTTAPTCTEKGYTTYTCSCEDSYIDNYVDELGHQPNQDWIITDTYHYHECLNVGCADKVNYAEHDFDKNKECADCGYITTALLGTEISSDIYEINGNTLFVKIANIQTSFTFAETVEVAKDATYKIYTDISCKESDCIASYVVGNLTTGNNTYYMLVSNEGTLPKIYTIVVYRNPMYTVTFETDGGTLIGSQTVEEDNLATEPTSNPIKEGYTFDGWDYDFSAPITKNTTINSKWKINQYTLTISYNNGQDDLVLTQDYNTSIQTIENPLKTGYTFNGWDNSIPSKMPAEDLIITAKWEINQYTITIVYNNGQSNKVIKQNYNTDVETIASPEKDGYTFDGWDKAIPSKMPAENKTITANWIANKDTAYRVEYYLQNIDNDLYSLDATYSFNDDGETDTTATVMPENIEHFTFNSSMSKLSGNIDGEGSLVLKVYYTRNSYEVNLTIQNSKAGTVSGGGLYKYGKEITISATTNAGYTFDGWYNGTNVVSTERNTFIVDKNINLVAKWTANEYVVTYNANSGIANKLTDTAIFDDYFTLATAERKGYTFDGWYDGSNIVNSGDWKIARDTTLTAKWKIVNYNISYNLDGGSATNFATYTVEDSFTLNQPKKTGYSFAGWIGTDITTANKFVTIEKGSIGHRSYTATWTANEYAVNYNANGGNVDKSSDTAIYDSYFTLATVTREGYTFDGWYSGTTKFTSGVWKTTEPVSLKAKWTANTYKIFYDVNGGELSNTQQSVVYDKNYSLSEPTRTGYTFVCWLYNGEKFNAGIWTIANNVTLTAKWDANKYTVIYDANDGVCDTEKDVITYDTTYSVPTPTRVGYTFNGWYYKGIEYFGGKWTTAEDITLTAEWIAHTNIPYIVNHHLENVDGSGYSLEESQDFTGTSDSFVTPSTNTYTGFSSPVEQKVKVNPNGSLVVDYLYTRNSYTITFVTNGGTAVVNQTYKYQEELYLPETEREGVTFGGWFTTQMLVSKFSNETMPASNKTVYAWWKEESKPSEFTYKGTEEIIITGYVGSSATMSIPMCIGDKLVTTIDASAFENKTNLLKVVVPNSVTSIGLGAFKGCNSIEDITLPFVGASETATYYEAVFGYIFGYEKQSSTSKYKSSTEDYPILYTEFANEKYTDVSLGVNQFSKERLKEKYVSKSGMTYYYNVYYYIDYYIYHLPTSIRNVTITSQTNIPVAAFNNCDFIETITLSADVENIGEYAFQNGQSLISFNSAEIGVFNIPKNVTNINNYVFYGCEKATTVTLGNNVSNIGNYAFSGCVNISKFNSENEYEFILPAKVVNIGKYAFQNVQTIKKVVVPDSVTSIGLGAFKGCNSIEDITLPFVGARAEATCYDAVFGYIFGYEKQSSDSKYKSSTVDYPVLKTEFLNKQYSDGTIGINQFSKERLKNYDSNKSGMTIYYLTYYYEDYYIYYIPTTIKNVTITSQTNIPVAAFNNCDFIETITLLTDVESIGDYAFQNCNATILYK